MKYSGFGMRLRSEKPVLIFQRISKTYLGIEEKYR
jgi:hypothetical protein